MNNSKVEHSRRRTIEVKTYTIQHGDDSDKRSFRRKKLKSFASLAEKKPHFNKTLDLTDALEFPMTPEMLLEHHKHRSILDSNEEWIVVVLNEYECLIDDLDVIKAIAFHSKFYEVNPEELWEEFFEFMEEVPSYDEVINSDVWQEFRDKRYSC